MQPRLDFANVAPDAYRAMLTFKTCVHQSGLEVSLLELVKTRASQMNHCAYCLDMHTKDARAHDEREQRLYTLSAWRGVLARLVHRLDDVARATHVRSPGYFCETTEALPISPRDSRRASSKQK